MVVHFPSAPSNPLIHNGDPNPNIPKSGYDPSIPSSLPPPPPLGEPSKSRREALTQRNEKSPPITLSNLCPIVKYYSAGDKVLNQFKSYLKSGDLDDAYVIGRRFALFSTVSLPNHDYYSSSSPELVHLRLKNQRDAQWVTRGLERIVGIMDKQELQKQREEEERKRVQMLEWERNMLERLDLAPVESVGLDAEAIDDSKQGGNQNNAISILDSADAKLEKLNALFPKIEELRTEDHTEDHDSGNIIDIKQLPPPIAPPLVSEQNSVLHNSTSAVLQLKSHGGTPLFPQPPSYPDLFLDTLRTSADEATIPMPLISKSIPPLLHTDNLFPLRSQLTPVRNLREKYNRQLESLQSSKKVEIIRLGTYQGRLSSTPQFDSTNGCTVISPLVVATHVSQQYTASLYGITNSAINDIIDKRAPPILSIIRSKLGLNRHALIIPSDVHDYLVDENILPQRKFAGVCGGNILDAGHVKCFLKMLVKGEDDKGNGDQVTLDTKNKSTQRKVGAALFFREHVISIITIPLGNGACYFDLIDSLPSQKAGGMASRTRCKDLSSLFSTIQWYACAKFSESNCNFIDTNEWDDGMCDFDPRVFQGFVWAY